MSDHLEVARSNRGFKHLPPISGKYGGEGYVYESSSAEGPHVWVRVEEPVDYKDPDGEKVEAHLHLSAEDAWKMADQLRFIVENHYQGDAVPPWVKE